tara:strand:- start:2100 stop:2462 length:363 start_codon:yes stop_codon:yes gene_type:complete
MGISTILSMGIKTNPIPATMLVFFEFDSHRIQTLEAQRLFEWLDDNGNRNAQLYVLEAHADNTGPTEYNDALKLKRAETVKDFLMRQGISGRKIVIRPESEIQEQTKPDFLYRRVRIILQ